MLNNLIISRNAFHRVLGFSLLEVMIAMTLGLFLTTIILEFYFTIRSTYNAEISIAHLQEEARNASIVLLQNIQMAGYSGCRRFNLFSAIKGFSSNNAPKYLNAKVKSGSDIIEINKADTKITALIKNAKIGDGFIWVETNSATKAQPQLLISNCNNAEIIIARNFANKKIVLSDRLKYSYNKNNSEVAKFSKIYYFVGKTSRKNIRGDDIYALYSITNFGKKEELIANIVNMQILYGIDGSGDNRVDNYVRANRVREWAQVKSLLINLTFITADHKNFSWPIYLELANNG